MRIQWATLPILLWLALPAAAGNHTPPPVQPATAFAAVEEHGDEQVAIAAEPYDTREKEVIFRVDYLGHGVLPIRIIVTNNGSQPISLLETHFEFLTAGGEKIAPAEPEDVERLMSRKEREGANLPLPGPLPGIKLKAKASNSEIEQDFNTFEYRAMTVEPHATRAGFFFFDVSAIDQPLAGAKLYLRRLRGGDGKELFFFEIPFDKYLKSKSNQMN
jgi:hypothetical protein